VLAVDGRGTGLRRRGAAPRRLRTVRAHAIWTIPPRAAQASARSNRRRHVLSPACGARAVGPGEGVLAGTRRRSRSAGRRGFGANPCRTPIPPTLDWQDGPTRLEAAADHQSHGSMAPVRLTARGATVANRRACPRDRPLPRYSSPCTAKASAERAAL